MKDIVNREISIGDMVAFNPPYCKGLLSGKVVKFTPVMVRIDYIDRGSGSERGVVVYPKDCCVLDKVSSV